MDSKTTFRFEAGSVRFELSGSEEFVRRNLMQFLPFVSRIAGVPGAPALRSGSAAQTAPSPGPTTQSAVSPTAQPAAAQPAAAAPAAPAAVAPTDLKTWYDQHVSAASRISMQDQILVFAFFQRLFKKYIFTSEDIRRGFETIGQSEPKSLLQILGTLKRDHNLILGTERRGEYMMNTTGIDRAREVLGIPSPSKSPAAQRGGEGTAGSTSAPREMSDAERAARAVMDI
ncbi:MAG: hypothetical protein K8T90_19700 [Planctomycetes bacterium]|nr:hypothetical protein [Planctomycetota bacterium]